MAQPEGHLNVPDVDRVEFERNFIRLAVCELRFPTLLEFQQECPPDFQKLMRKRYPHYERGANISLLPSGERHSETRYIFRPIKQDLTVSLRPFAISIETRAYKHFEMFLEQVEWVVQQAVTIIDSDFFTRVGLRYINVLPVEGNPTGWLREELVKPLTDNVFGNPPKYTQIVSGSLADGHYNFRHGLEDGQDEKRSYILDFDLYREEIQIKDLKSLLIAFNLQNFKLFRWAISNKSLDYLGKAHSKD